MPAELLPIVERFPGRRVLLVGDFMLDCYVFGDAERISPEAPVPVLRVLERQERVGGAGSVALNVLALGAHVVCCGLLGTDAFGDRVEKALHDAGADVRGLIRADNRPTITKTRLVGLAEHRHRQQILRVDEEVVRPLSGALQDNLRAHFQAAVQDVDIVCLEDYGKGVLLGATCEQVIAVARAAGKRIFVDPARAPDWERYRHATVMLPNRTELEIACQGPLADAALEDAARKLLTKCDLQALLVKLGRDGVLLVPRDGAARMHPTTPRAVYDSTGAGDAVLAMFTVAVGAGADFHQAAILANVAGGLEVGKFGAVPIARDEVMADLVEREQRSRGKLRTLGELKAELGVRRQRGETIVLTNGCFDVLHPGHVALLVQAKRRGVLVVGINSDAAVRRLKGPGRPVRNEEDRVRMLAALDAVDYVVVFDDDSALPLVREVSPDVLVKGGDYTLEGVVGREWVESHGGRVEIVPLAEGFSTSVELARIRARPRQEMA